MPTIRVNRELAASLALTSLFCAQGCYVYQRPPGPMLAAGAVARVQSHAPFFVQAGGPSATPSGAACRATYVEGVVDTSAADTLTFRQLRWIRPTKQGDAPCLAIKERAVVVRPDEARVTVRRYSGGRTLLLVVGVAVVSFVALLALTWNNVDWSSTGDGCLFDCYYGH